MTTVQEAERAQVRARATAWSLTSWVLFASSGPLAEAVIAAAWSPAAVAFVRIALAAALLIPVVAVFRPRALRFRRSDLPLLVGYGLLGVAGVQLLFLIAVQRIPIGVAMVLVNLAPALVALWVRYVRRIHLPTAVWLGIGLAATGLTLVAQIWDSTRLDALGIAAGLGSAICSAGYFLLGEHGARKHDPLALTSAGLTIGAIAVAALAAPWTLHAGQFTTPAVLGGLPLPAWLVLLALAIAGTALPYLAGLRALRDLPSTLASVLSVVEPLVAAALAWLLLGQSLTPIQITGAAIMLVGAILVQLTVPEDHSPTSTARSSSCAEES